MRASSCVIAVSHQASPLPRADTEFGPYTDDHQTGDRLHRQKLSLLYPKPDFVRGDVLHADIDCIYDYVPSRPGVEQVPGKSLVA